VEEPEGNKIGVSLVFFGGPQSYDMTEVNHANEADNAALGGAGFETKDVTGGFGFGAGVRIERSRKYALQFDYNRLPASARRSGLIPVNVPVEQDISVPANALLLTAEAFRQWHGIHYGLGVGGGYYLCHGNINNRVAGNALTYKVHGSGLGLHLMGIADIAISRTLHFDGALGYRSAKTGNLKVGENDLVVADGSAVHANWTGMTLRLGFSIPFNPGPYPEGHNR